MRRSLCDMLNRPKNLLRERELYTVQSEKVDEEISNSCEDIKQRGTYPENPGSEDEEKFPIVFIRAYYVQKMLFNLMYASQNLYYYALDSKSSDLFHEHMRNLSKCFSNVILTGTEYEVDSAGHNMIRSCMVGNCVAKTEMEICYFTPGI
ncbi:core-2/I-Branching enzyme family protein [Loa loa]|uniref:Core-2/I-Branching enzyme family protein n=1 Tax=Loa loa TaxID=7209 RepID=A0A1S0TRH6_LOALO|nr:core-2/I-Branching enzyme family protein [Loa loa]EFO18925.2 core-2/I-Branching enzyme family protein [Loa loa]